MIDNFEKLLLLKINISRLDNTGLTSIEQETDDWHTYLSDNVLEGMSPIEKIMRIILIDIEDKLEVEFNSNNPFIIVNPQYKIENYRADFLVELWNGKGNKYIIECDGHDFHEKTKEQAEYDKKRERVFVSRGYKVLRYSGSELYRDFEKIKNELFEIFSSEYIEVCDD